MFKGKPAFPVKMAHPPDLGEIGQVGVDLCLSRCANISTPTLRRVREGWGTPSVIYASEIKSLGHPPEKDG